MELVAVCPICHAVEPNPSRTGISQRICYMVYRAIEKPQCVVKNRRMSPEGSIIGPVDSSAQWVMLCASVR